MLNKLKQFKDLRDKAKAIQAALAEEMIEQTTKGVTIKMDGNQQVHEIHFDDAMLQDKTRLQAAIIDAFNDSIKKVQKTMAMKLQQMGDLDIPGLS